MSHSHELCTTRPFLLPLPYLRDQFMQLCSPQIYKHYLPQLPLTSYFLFLLHCYFHQPIALSMVLSFIVIVILLLFLIYVFLFQYN